MARRRMRVASSSRPSRVSSVAFFISSREMDITFLFFVALHHDHIDALRSVASSCGATSWWSKPWERDLWNHGRTVDPKNGQALR